MIRGTKLVTVLLIIHANNIQQDYRRNPVMSVPVMTMEIHSTTCRIQSYKYYYLYQNPRRFCHLALLCRWRAGDMHQLRQGKYTARTAPASPTRGSI